MKRYCSAVILAVASIGAHAVPVAWTDWTSVSGNLAEGTINVNGTSIGVSVASTSGYYTSHIDSGTANPWGAVWSGPAYTNGSVDNAPVSEFLGFGTGGTVTVTFDQTVRGVYLAMNSWENQSVNFGEAITVDSSGPGNWGGTGAYTPYANGEGFTTGGNPDGNWHGVVSLSGSRMGFSFTHNTELWHGITVGIAEVPAPATFALFAAALLALGFVKRRTA